MIWRGPMASRLVQQFFSGVVWGELDYLIVDLPPGTGDVQLTIAQTVALAGAVIVTTPQAVARTIAEKGLRMFQPVGVPVLGVIENMGAFLCPHCGAATEIFSSGGGEEVARELGLSFLGAIPLDPAVVAAGDEGCPTVIRDPGSPRRRRLSRHRASRLPGSRAVEPAREQRARRVVPGRGRLRRRRLGGRPRRPPRIRVPQKPLPLRDLRGRVEREAPVADAAAADELRPRATRSGRQLRRADPLERRARDGDLQPPAAKAAGATAGSVPRGADCGADLRRRNPVLTRPGGAAFAEPRWSERIAVPPGGVATGPGCGAPETGCGGRAGSGPIRMRRDGSGFSGLRKGPGRVAGQGRPGGEGPVGTVAREFAGSGWVGRWRVRPGGGSGRDRRA